MMSIERLVRIHNLQLENQNGLHDGALIERDERCRRSATRLLIAQHEIEALRRELRKESASAEDLSHQSSHMQNSLKQLEAIEVSQKQLLASKDGEIERLKAQLHVVDTRTIDAKKELQENIKLKEELAQLLHEMDELQLQIASHEKVIAAKKALQQQVESLEHKLNESHRAIQQSTTQKHNLARLEKALAETERLLAAERSRSGSLENKMKQSQSKRTATSATTSAYQIPASLLPSLEGSDECDEANEQKNTENSEDEWPAECEAEASHQDVRRSGASIGSPADGLVETPGNDSRKTTSSKIKGLFAGVGQKSNFSVTPFLNKTTAIYESDASDPSDAESATAVLKPKTSITANSMPVARLKRSRVEQQSERRSTVSRVSNQQRTVLGESKSSERNKAFVPTTQRTQPQARQVIQLSVEPDGQENTPSPVSLKPSLANNHAADGKKRKRMVFGAAMRVAGDDEDAEYLAPQARVVNKRVSKINLGGASSIFASDGTSFSPLKRDRRGRSTSFLG